MGTVVVGLDGSEQSRLAFDAALTEAELKGHVVRAVHVYSYPATTIYQATRLDVGDLHAYAEEWLDQELDDLQDRCGGDFPVKVERVVRMGHAGTELAEEATEADLLVLGSRGLGGVRGVLMGSVSTFATHHLRCPLLIIPSRHDDDED